MRLLTRTVTFAATVLIPVGIALSSPLPAPARVAPPSAPAPVHTAANTTGAAFPYCPAPSIRALDAAPAGKGASRSLAIRVVVQNVGNRAMFADGTEPRVVVRMNGAVIGTYGFDRLGAGELRFVFLTATPPDGEAGATLEADLDIAAALDCRSDDNHAVRRVSLAGLIGG